MTNENKVISESFFSIGSIESDSEEDFNTTDIQDRFYIMHKHLNLFSLLRPERSLLMSQ